LEGTILTSFGRDRDKIDGMMSQPSRTRTAQAGPAH
jgi:hypothetical protein